MKRERVFRITVMLMITAGAVFLFAGQGVRDGFLGRGGSTRGKYLQQERITVAGSTSMEKFALALSESFMEEYPSVMVNVEFIGSSAGIESMLSGSADIAASSRRLNESEKSSGAIENIAAMEAIVIITDRSNTVTSLTLEQLTGIYAGRIRSWREVGGEEQPIVVVGREAGSGTRETFEKLLGMEEQCAYANELDSNGAVMARIAATPGAVGYVSRDVLDETVQAVSLDGHAPTDRNISEGVYPLTRPLIMVTKGDIPIQKAAVQKFFSYLYSEKGRQLIESVGLMVPEPYVIHRQ